MFFQISQTLILPKWKFDKLKKAVQFKNPKNQLLLLLIIYYNSKLAYVCMTGSEFLTQIWTKIDPWKKNLCNNICNVDLFCTFYGIYIACDILLGFKAVTNKFNITKEKII